MAEGGRDSFDCGHYQNGTVPEGASYPAHRNPESTARRSDQQILTANQHDQSLAKSEVCILEAWSDAQLEFLSEGRMEIVPIDELQTVDDDKCLPRRLQYLAICSKANLHKLAKFYNCEMDIHKEGITFQIPNHEIFEKKKKDILHRVQLLLDVTCEDSIKLSKDMHVNFNAGIKKAGIQALNEGLVMIFSDRGNKDSLVLVGQDHVVLEDTTKSVKSFAAGMKTRASSSKPSSGFPSNTASEQQQQTIVEESICIYEYEVVFFHYWINNLKEKFPSVTSEFDGKMLVLTGSRKDVNSFISELDSRRSSIKYERGENVDDIVCTLLCKDHAKQYTKKKLQDLLLLGTYHIDKEKGSIRYFGRDDEEAKKVKQVVEQCIKGKKYRKAVLDPEFAKQTLQEFKSKIATKPLDTETFQIVCTDDVMGELVRKLDSVEKLYNQVDKQKQKRQSCMSETDSGNQDNSGTPSSIDSRTGEGSRKLEPRNLEADSPSQTGIQQRRQGPITRTSISLGRYRLLKRLGMKDKISLELDRNKKVSQWRVEEGEDGYFLSITRPSRNLKEEDCLSPILGCIPEVAVEKAIFEEAKSEIPGTIEYEVSDIIGDLNELCVTAFADDMKIISPILLNVGKGSQRKFEENKDLEESLHESLDYSYFADASAKGSNVDIGSEDPNFTGGIVPLKSVEVKYLFEHKLEALKGIMRRHDVVIGNTLEHDGVLVNGTGDITTAKRDIMDLLDFRMERFNVDVGQIKEEKLKKVTKELEQRYKSRIEVDLKSDDEPEYLCSWLRDGESMCIVLCYGRIENSKADMIVCPCNVTPSPHGEISNNILKKGGKGELESDLVERRKEFAASHRKQVGDIKMSVGDVLFGSKTGHLNCVGVAYPIIPMWSSMEKIDDDALSKMARCFIEKMNADGLRSVVFPADFNKRGPVWKQMTALIVNWFIEHSRWPKHRMEIQFCTKSFDDSVVLQQILNGNIFSDVTKDPYAVVDQMIRFDPIQLEDPPEAVPLAVHIVQNSLVDQAPHVDVIVNSASCDLNLKSGRVSASILKRGGNEIQQECDKNYPDGIPYGQMAVTGPGKLRCKMICHIALLGFWIPDGNFSLKVLRALMIRCLQISDEKGYRSIAFPALGTGNLEYPWCRVARTMYDVVDEYGKRRTDRNLQKVFFIIHHTDVETYKAFEFEEKCRKRHVAEKVSSSSSMELFETRIPALGCKFQVMSENVFKTNPAKPECQLWLKKQNFIGGSSLKPCNWSVEESCCLMELLVQGDHASLKAAIEQSLKKIQELRLTSVAVMFPTQCGYEPKRETIEMIKECVKKYFEKGLLESLGSLMGADRDNKIIYLREVQICIMGKISSNLEQQKQTWAASLFSSKYTTKWTKVTKSFGQCFDVQIATGNHETTRLILRELQRWIYGVDESEYTGTWCIPNPSDKKKPKALSPNCIDQLNRAVRDRKSTIDFYDEKTKQTFVYYLEEGYRQPLGGTSKKKEGIIYIAPPSPTLGSRTDSESSFEFVSSGEVEPNQIHVGSDGSGSKIASEKEVFQIVTAELNLGDDFKLQNVKDLLLHSGIKAEITHSKTKDAILIKGRSLSDVQKAEELLKGNQKKKTGPPIKRLSSREEGKTSESVIPLGNTNFKTFEFFASKEKWFSSKRNMIKTRGDDIVLSHGITSDVKELVDGLLKRIQNMPNQEVELAQDEYQKAGEIVESLKQTEDLKDILIERRMNHIVIISEDYDYITKIKHKVDLALGRIKVAKGARRARQFGTGPPDSQQGSDATEQGSTGNLSRQISADPVDLHQNTGQTEKPSTAKPRGKRDFSNLDVKNTETGTTSSTAHGSSFDKGTFMAKNGMIVKVYCDSITKLNVDCIVNAANDSLSHGAGVALAISRAAGRDLVQEGNSYIRKYGRIDVGKCCVTTAGDLPYNCVIHTVGPRWHDYTDKRVCLQLLQQAVLVTFEVASKRNLRSIAVPAISSGIFGVPKLKCVEQYFKAVEEYCKTYGGTRSLQEIHFVDKDEDMVKLIQSQFAAYNWDFTSPGNTPVADPQGRSNLTKSRKSSTKSTEFSESKRTAVSAPVQTKSVHIPRPVSSCDEYCYRSLKVLLYKGDICATKVDMVVCPQDTEFRARGMIAKAICDSHNELHEEYEWSKLKGRKATYGKVYTVKVKTEASHWKYVAHAVPPRYFKDKSKNNFYASSLKETVKNVLRDMKELNCFSVGMPVLGAAEMGAETPLAIVADCISAEIKRFGDSLSGTNTYYIHIIYFEDVQRQAFDSEFSRKFDKVQVPFTATEDVEMRDVTDMDEKSTAQLENCSICMDTPENPKALGCGHTFCTDCINQYFENYKAACPNCGQIFGRIEGDQPDGEISISIKPYVHLPGYEAFGTIIVTYSFPDGKQGEDHPNPGKPYKGIVRSGNLPYNTDGKLVAKLLNVAFSRRLTFTIGRSRTTGHDGVLTWNDIHHKTRTHGGTDRFGYPDETYLERVLDELSVKGVTKKSADDPKEFSEYTRVFGQS